MMKMKLIGLAEATKLQIDWLVAKLEGVEIQVELVNGNLILIVVEGAVDSRTGEQLPYGHEWSPSSIWAQGGPIIEREHIFVTLDGDIWRGSLPIPGSVLKTIRTGETYLLVAMRAYATSRFGDEAEVPDLL